MIRSTVVLGALFALACGSPAAGTDAGGGGSDTGASAAGGSCAMTASYTCVDYEASGATLDAYQSACTMSGSTWSTSGCTHAGSVGGCHYTASSGSGAGTTWTYAGGPYADAAAARTGCETGTPPGTYVAP